MSDQAPATPQQSVQSLARLTTILARLIELEAPPEIITNQTILCRDRLDEIVQELGDPTQTEIYTGGANDG